MTSRLDGVPGEGSPFTPPFIREVVTSPSVRDPLPEGAAPTQGSAAPSLPIGAPAPLFR